MASSSGQLGATSLAGRLKNRLRRSVQHDSGGGSPTAQSQLDDSASESGSTAAGGRQQLDGGDSEELQQFEIVPETQSGQQQPPDLDDCAELSELLMTVADEEQLRAQLVSLAIENEALRARAGQAESELVTRLRRQLSEERIARLRAETAATDAAAAAVAAAAKPASGGPISRAVAGLRRRREARAARAAAATVGGASGVAEGIEAAAAAVDDAEIESLDSDSDAEAADDAAGSERRRRRPASFCNRVKTWTVGIVLDLMEDLQQPADSEPAVAAAMEEPQLSARRLKANASRFGRNARPLTRCLRGLRGILQWRSPSYTALVIMMYCFALRYDLLIPLLLLLCIARLCLNYLKYRLHWSFEFNFVSDYDSTEDEDAADNQRTVGTQVNMVVQVARKAQNLAGKLSDNMEKFKNLVTWRSPKHAQRLLHLLVLAFALSIVFPSSTCLQVVGLYLGVKLFIIDALVARYPRLRRRFDGATKMWRALPTDQQLRSLQASEDVEKYILPASDDEGASGAALSGAAAGASGEAPPSPPSQQHQQLQFSQAFSLPAAEVPLARWRGGKRCAIVCKDGERSLPLPSWLKHGKLFLTRSFLCFERSKDRGKAKKRNLVIPLAMIRWIKKTKPFAWLPGGGMSIEVQIFGVEKPLTFGAIIGRDEVFESLLEAGKRAGLAWAGGAATADGQQQPPQADPQLVKSVNQALMSDSDLED